MEAAAAAAENIGGGDGSGPPCGCGDDMAAAPKGCCGEGKAGGWCVGWPIGTKGCWYSCGCCGAAHERARPGCGIAIEWGGWLIGECCTLRTPVNGHALE